jgi:FkbH-like protein
MWGEDAADWIPLNNFSKLPSDPPRPIGEYDFQVIQVATRSFLREREYFSLPIADEGAWKDFFESTVDRLRLALESFLEYNVRTGLLTFVSNFMIPQQNPLGRFMPRNDFRNFAHFFRKLNEALSDIVAGYSNVYVLDVDEIAASIGRRYVQDDVIWSSAHNAAMSNFDADLDRARIEPAGQLSDVYQMKVHVLIEETIHELRALHVTARGTNSVKMVVTDLDDTLWRGLVGEGDQVSNEGWPHGYAEALSILARRGILVAAISKNDEAVVRAKWNSFLSIDNLVALRVNWIDKVTNMQDLLAEVNLLPGNVVYIDDNPVERQNMKLAFPQMRVLGGNPYVLRHILLWAPEVQVPALSNEATRRTEMVSRQIAREQLKRTVSREEFLASLGVRVQGYRVESPADARFQRSFELLNKTNQFNTTGHRWTMQEAAASFDDGCHWFCFDCQDAFTDYGIISVALVAADGVIRQMVLSCRVFGFDVERGILSLLTGLASLRPRVHVAFEGTDKNHVAFQMLKDIGFSESQGLLSIQSTDIEAVPSHITCEGHGALAANA